ncbi:MAG: hypothetical protein JWM90_361 [Thermoleophilia bacterium]|nr:hypothetical protein [Thermoleophilia bacterium]
MPIAAADMYPRLLPSLAALAVLLLCPAMAAATTPPTLTAPAANSASFTEGQSIEFTWSGALQGDPDTLARSYFRLEIAAAADVPTGSQSEWTETEDFRVTEAGQTETTAMMGVPAAGAYKWRVCAWGVVDDIAANVMQQLPGGCSGARSFTTTAATAASVVVTELEQKKTITAPGTTKYVDVKRPAAPAPAVATPEPTPDADPVVEEPLQPAGFQEVVRRTLRESGPAVDLGSDTFDSDASADRAAPGGRVGRIVSGGLSASLPFVKIPYWTLLLLAACVPILRAWRRSVLGMFDWPDGTIDGSGMPDDSFADLPNVQLGRSFKDDRISTDGDTHPTSQPVPEREQLPA